MRAPDKFALRKSTNGRSVAIVAETSRLNVDIQKEEGAPLGRSFTSTAYHSQLIGS
jgi:hypothetical protein